MDSVPFNGGRITKTSSGYEINYHIKDQVGSVRAVVNQNNEIKQQNDYYAFGLKHENAGLSASDNRYQFSSKESQSEFGIGYYDFHARQYDPNGAIFTSQDPLQDKFTSVSSYNYCFNSPISYSDPTGLFPIETFWDIGMVLFGTALAIEDHIKGNHDEARDSWAAVGLDVTATFIPYVPAVGVATRLALRADNVVDGVKAVDKAVVNSKSTYNRVKLRKGTKEQIYKNQKINAQGEMIDPNTYKALEPGKIDIGHKPNQGWKKRKKDHKDNNRTRKEVIEMENDPDLYQLEDRYNNRSHKFE